MRLGGWDEVSLLSPTRERPRDSGFALEGLS
jgi:hypothetical protein